MAPKVAIQRYDDYDGRKIYSALKSTVSLFGGSNNFFKRGDSVLIKPNLLSAKPRQSAVTTHPAFVKAVINLVKEAGATPLIGDSPGIGNAAKIAHRCGVEEICRETGVENVFEKGYCLKTPNRA